MSDGVEIVSTLGVVSGKPRIAGTRVRVQDVVYYHRARWSVEKIGESLNLTPDQVNTALTYYAEHKADIDADLRLDEEYAHQVAGRSDEAKRRLKARLVGK